MENIDPKQDRRVDRRTVLKRGLIAGGLLARRRRRDRAAARRGHGQRLRLAAEDSAPPARRRARRRRSRQAHPNILVIVVDQLRFPQWFSPDPAGVGAAAQPPAPAPGGRLVRAGTTPRPTTARPRARRC